MKSPRLIERQLTWFLREAVAQTGASLIVPVERKGTAIVRSLLERDDDLRLNHSWNEVISSSALDRLPPDTANKFKGKVVLVFDDMMHSGHHVYKEVLPRLQEKLDASRIVVAAFAVHDDCPKDRCPDTFFYSGLSHEAYGRIRLSIVDMLQRRGSLLLDTEHIEVRASIHCDMRQFFEAFAECGQVACFESAGGRINATVDMSSGSNDNLPLGLPAGSEAQNCVRKCRIIERPDGEFAIIPICFPSTPAKFDEWPGESRVKRLFEVNPSDGKEIFYAVGLVMAVNILGDILAALAELGSQRVTVYGPTSGNRGYEEQGGCARVGYTLDHLVAMYPSIRIPELTRWVWDVCANPGMAGSGKRAGCGELIDVPPADLTSWAVELAQVVRCSLDLRGPSHNNEESSARLHPCGVTFPDLLHVGQELWNVSEPLARLRTSVALDRLIDEAYFVTHVESTRGSSGERFKRTFEPDGEVVSSLIRRYTALSGLSSRARGCLVS